MGKWGGVNYDFKTLIKEADVREFLAADLDLPSVPKDGRNFLREAGQRFAKQSAAIFRRSQFEGEVEVTSYPSASMPWYADREIRFLIWPGDLVIEGDLLDSDFSMMPMLIVRGDLIVRHWLRGDMPAFIGGQVKASGFIIGHYNDSALFVGGDLTAEGYLSRARPYRDRPNVAPHQIAGKIQARQFDLYDAPEEKLRAAFVDEVLVQEDEDTFLEEPAVFARFNEGLTVWR